MLHNLIAALPLLTLASATEHWWNISYANVNPDGLFERRVIGVNGSWPPPPLTAVQGEKLIVHTYNGLGDKSIGTALHTHGLFFNGTNHYDGAVMINQCAIPEGETLSYEIDTDLQTGTYWIHGHHEGQYTDGLRAPLVIHPNSNATGRSDNTTWDDEYTVVVSDWYHDEFANLIKDEFLNWRNPTGAEPVPSEPHLGPSRRRGSSRRSPFLESAMIYVAQNASYLNTNEEISRGVGVNNDAKLTFEAGKSYRIRVVNMGSLAMFFLHIDQHDMYIIEADGVEVAPYLIDTLTVAVAQRYSILVQAKNTTDTNYAMVAIQSQDMYDSVPDDLVVNNTLQIVYNSANSVAPEVILDTIPTLNDTEFVPIVAKHSAPADVVYELNVWFDTYDDGTNRASFNNITYQMPTVPTMFTALTMGNDSLNDKVYGAQTNGFAYEHMKQIQLDVYNWDAGFHPFHLHGHEFQVLYKSFDVTSNDTTINPVFDPDQENPSRRDTITIPPGGMVRVSWRADNPGAWMFHCHIDWHLSSGLAAVFIEAPEVFQTTETVPSVFYDHCNFWDIKTSGNIVGLNSTTDFAGQPWGPFPLKMGWTPKAIGALAGCIISALVGFGTIVWYGWGELDEEEIEEEVKLAVEAKKNKKSLFQKLTRK
ncbi:iron transport multicopper oxidase, partial [Tremellales sp. Uapishka_1]